MHFYISAIEIFHQLVQLFREIQLSRRKSSAPVSERLPVMNVTLLGRCKDSLQLKRALARYPVDRICILKLIIAILTLNIDGSIRSVVRGTLKFRGLR